MNIHKYIATFDTGTDFTCIKYSSEHRNHSKANAVDARREARRKHGRAAAGWQLTHTELYK
uniref:Uncharacterized protein n=1 Tax=Siphoviridae sp. ctGsX68 TaxID=2825417 RepID=A0A8S5UUG8_9CAUD|nr:MAG TPA: hypothetical protein [Caudoviricetes sp.]DAF98068.1 MAG TPA: hypothetical protein [Siphoviridae sp. ctGsX68]